MIITSIDSRTVTKANSTYNEYWFMLQHNGTPYAIRCFGNTLCRIKDVSGDVISCSKLDECIEFLHPGLEISPYNDLNGRIALIVVNMV